MPGIAGEEVLHIPRLFDCLLNNLLIYRCDVSQNTLDGFHSQDYHIELIGGSGKHNTGSLVRLKLAEVTSASLYQVESKIRINNFIMTCVDFQGEFQCQDGPFMPQIKIVQNLEQIYHSLQTEQI